MQYNIVCYFELVLKLFEHFSLKCLYNTYNILILTHIINSSNTLSWYTFTVWTVKGTKGKVKIVFQEFNKNNGMNAVLILIGKS